VEHLRASCPELNIERESREARDRCRMSNDKVTTRPKKGSVNATRNKKQGILNVE
jgi:hypothetical protein